MIAGGKSFYVHLPSNTENATFNNTATNFVIKLPKNLEFTSEWAVGLSEILFPAIRNEDMQPQQQREKRSAEALKSYKPNAKLEFPENKVLQAMEEIAKIKHEKLTVAHTRRFYHLLIDETKNPKFKQLFEKVKLLNEPFTEQQRKEFFDYVNEISKESEQPKLEPTEKWFFEENIFKSFVSIFKDHKTADTVALMGLKELFIFNYKQQISELNQQRSEIEHYIYEISFYLYEEASPNFIQQKIQLHLDSPPPRWHETPEDLTNDYLGYIYELMNDKVENNQHTNSTSNLKLLLEQCDKILKQAKVIHELLEDRDDEAYYGLDIVEEIYEKLKRVDIVVHGYDEAINESHAQLYHYAHSQNFDPVVVLDKWFDKLMKGHAKNLKNLGEVFNSMQTVLKEWKDGKKDAAQVFVKLKREAANFEKKGTLKRLAFSRVSSHEYNNRRERMRILIERSRINEDMEAKFWRKLKAKPDKNKTPDKQDSVSVKSTDDKTKSTTTQSAEKSPPKETE